MARQAPHLGSCPSETYEINDRLTGLRRSLGPLEELGSLRPVAFFNYLKQEALRRLILALRALHPAGSYVDGDARANAQHAPQEVEHNEFLIAAYATHQFIDASHAVSGA